MVGGAVSSQTFIGRDLHIHPSGSSQIMIEANELSLEEQELLCAGYPGGFVIIDLQQSAVLLICTERRRFHEAKYHRAWKKLRERRLVVQDGQEHYDLTSTGEELAELLQSE